MYKTFSYFLVGLMISSFALKAQTPAPAFDVQHYNFAIQLNDDDNNIKGQATIKVKFLENADGFTLSLVKKNNKDKGMLISSITYDGKPVTFAQDSDDVHINTAVKQGSLHSYTINYEGIPAD